MIRRDESGADRHEMLAGYAILAVVAGIALATVALVVQQGRDRPFEGVLLVVGTLAAGLGVQLLQAAVPRAEPMESAAQPALTEPPPSLRRVESSVAFSCSRAFDAYMLLRPALRDVAAQRLDAHGVDLDTDARAQIMMGPWAWALLRPDLPEPGDWYAPGLDPRALEHVVEALERL